MRPMIAVLARKIRGAGGKYSHLMPEAEGVYRPYVEAVWNAGGFPVVIPRLADDEVSEAVHGHFQGFLFTGGEDIDPVQYGVTTQIPLQGSCDLRDKVELALARRLLSSPKPTLGICRGLELLNVAAGGTLHPDLKDELGTSVNHFNVNGGNPFADTAHSIEIVPGTFLHRLLAAGRLDVNSLHHAGINRLAEGLKASAHSPDDQVIEGFEFEDPSRGFMMGIQCHPEALCDQIDRRWAAVFKAFVDAARASA